MAPDSSGAAGHPPLPTDRADEEDSHKFFRLPNDHVRSILEKNAASMFTGEDDDIQRRIALAEIQERTQEMALESIVHSRMPMAIIVSRRRAHIGLLFLVGLWLWEVAAARMLMDQLWRFRHFRLTPTALRNGTMPDSFLGLSDFRLHLDGCMISEHNSTVQRSADGKSLIKSFAGEVAVNGWSLLAADGPASEDAVAFRVEGSDDYQAWELVGTGSWRSRPWDPKLSFTNHEHTHTPARGGELVFEPRLSPEPKMVLVSRICNCILVAAAITLAWLDQRREAAWLLVMCVLVFAACDMFTAITHMATAEARHFFMPLSSGLLHLWVATGLTFGAAGRRLVELMGLGLLWACLSVLDSTVLWHDSDALVVLRTIPLPAWVMSVLFVWCSVVKRRRLQHSRQAMEGVEREYNAAWAALLCAVDHQDTDALKDLSVLLDKVAKLGSRNPRHNIQALPPPTATENLNGAKMGSLLRTAVTLRRAATAGKKQLVHFSAKAAFQDRHRTLQETARTSGHLSMEEEPMRVSDADQVYVQAAGVWPFFNAKVLQWAAASDGYLRVKVDVPDVDAEEWNLASPSVKRSPSGSTHRSKRASWVGDMTSSRRSPSSPKQRSPKRASVCCYSLDFPRTTQSSPEHPSQTVAPLPARCASEDLCPTPQRAASSEPRGAAAAIERCSTESLPRSESRQLDPSTADLFAATDASHMEITKNPSGGTDGEDSRVAFRSLRTVRRVVSLLSMNTFTTVSSLDKTEAATEWCKVTAADQTRVAWEGLKSKTRAAHKILKVYDGDASRLVDVCRQRIVFDSIRSLRHCVHEILRDKDNIRVLRVKNMLAHDHNVRWSAGFRAVIINLAIVVPQTVALSLHLHVAELQLVLKPFVDIQEKADHSHYVQYRNARSTAPESFGLVRSLFARFAPAPLRGSNRVASSHSDAVAVAPDASGTWSSPSDHVVLTASELTAAAKQADAAPPPHHADLAPIATAPTPDTASTALLVDEGELTPRPYHSDAAVMSLQAEQPSELDAGVATRACSSGVTGLPAAQHGVALAPSQHASPFHRTRSAEADTRKPSLGLDTVGPHGGSGAGKRPKGSHFSSLDLGRNQQRRHSGGCVTPRGGAEGPKRGRRGSLGATLDWGRSLLVGSVKSRDVAGVTPSAGWNYTYADLLDVMGKGQKPWLEWTNDRLAKVFADMTPLDRVLKDLLIMGARNPGGRLRQRMEGALHEAVKGARMASVSFSSTPLPAVASYLRVQVALLLVAALFVASAVSFNAHGSARLLAFRTSVATQMASAPVARVDSAILGGGLMLDGCPVGGGIRQGQQRIGGMSFEYPSGVRANGWYVVLDGREAASAGKHLVHASALREEDEEWTCLFAGEDDEECLKTLDANLESSWRMHEVLFPGSEHEKVVFSQDLREDGASVLGWVVVPALRALAYGGVAGSGMLKSTQSSRWILGGLQLVVAAVLCVVGAMRDQGGSEALWWYIRGVAMVVLSAAVLVQHRGLVLVQAFSSACDVVAVHGLARYRMMHKWTGEGSRAGSWSEATAADLVIIGLCIYLWVGWRVAVFFSGRMIKNDRAAYDAEWSQLLRDEGGREELRRLEETVASMRASEETVLRQRAGDDATMVSTASLTDAMQTATGSRSMLYLDQVYAQAYVVDFLLRRNVCQWAALCNGYLRAKTADRRDEATAPRWIKFSDSANRPELRMQIQWGGVKKVERAIEKAMRSYHGDVSRLVDVSRACIAFESLQDLQQCLLEIKRDEGCKVVRIKNRLSVSWDASQSAGYRDVALNLQICGADAQRLRVASHISEIQLILLPFARLKSNQGHNRYVHFRNARAQ